MAKSYGFNIVIGGNVTQLNKSLKQAQSSIKSASGDVKSLKSYLKVNPSDSKGWVSLGKSLQKQLTATEQKLQTLKSQKDQVDKAFAEGKISGKEWAEYNQELANAEKEYKDLSKQVANFNPKLEETKAKLSGLSDKFATATEKTKKFSAACAATAAGLITMGLKASQSADDILTVSQQSGFSTETLQEFQYAAERVDVSADTVVGACRKMKKNMTDTNSGFQALGISMDALAGKSMDQVFMTVVEALSKVEDGTERDQIAMDIFGKSADDLAGIIDDGGESFKKYSKEAKNLGLILSQDDLEAAGKIDDAIQKIKITFEKAFIKAGTNLDKTLLPTIEKLADAAASLASMIAKIPGPVLAATLKMALFGAAISPVLKGISGVLSVASTLTPLLGGLGTAAAGAAGTAGLGALSTAAAGVAGTIGTVLLPVLGGVAIGTLVAGTTILIIKNWGNIKKAAVNVGKSIKSAWSGVVNHVRNTTAYQAVSQRLGNIKKAYDSTDNHILGVFRAGKTTIQQYFTDIYNVANRMTNGGVSKVTSAVRSGFNTMRSTASSVLSNITASAKGATRGISGAFASMRGTVSGHFSTLASSASSVVGSIKNIFGAMGQSITGTFNSLHQSAASIFGQIGSSISSTMGNCVNGVKGLFGGLKDSISNAMSGIKLPHFKSSGSFGNNHGKVTVPKINVEWYAKAMHTPMLLNKPTIFGASGSSLLGAGEAGVEVVTGADKLMNMISRAVGQTINNSYGGITVNVYQQQGQDSKALVDTMMQELTRAIKRKDMAFA